MGGMRLTLIPFKKILEWLKENVGEETAETV